MGLASGQSQVCGSGRDAKGETWNLGTRIWQAHECAGIETVCVWVAAGPLICSLKPDLGQGKRPSGLPSVPEDCELGLRPVAFVPSHLATRSQQVDASFTSVSRPVRRLMKKRPEPTISSEVHPHYVLTGSWSWPALSCGVDHIRQAHALRRARSGRRALLQSPCEGCIRRDIRALGPVQYHTPLIAWKPETAGRRWVP